MGMYTGLRVHVKIKEKYYHIIERMFNDTNHFDVWEGHGYDFTDNFSQYSRNFFIPFGALAYMPWDDHDPKWQHSFVDGEWKFQCSLKNYDETIEYFLENVLSELIEESYYIEFLYEEWATPTLYDFKDGKFIKIQQGEWDYYNDYNDMS